MERESEVSQKVILGQLNHPYRQQWIKISQQKLLYVCRVRFAAFPGAAPRISPKIRGAFVPHDVGDVGAY
ncbi:MAG: hypothetical protein NVSMB6_02520 [Burkholderiaceae bacterium]